MQPSPSLGASIGRGFSSGVSKGMDLKLSDMLEQKKIDRESKRNEGINESLYNIKSGANPQVVGSLYKVLLEHGGMKRANRARDIAAGLPDKVDAERQEEPPKYINPNEPVQEPEIPEQEAPEYEVGSVKDLENRRSKIVDDYNLEEDPKVKKEVYSTIKDLNKQILDQKKEERENKLANYKLEAEQRGTIKKVNDEYNATLKKRPIYRIMESKAPELQSTSTLRRYLMDRLNLPPGVMLNPTSEVLEKVSQQLLRGITAEYSGAGRILQSEVENYVKSNPSLLNSPEGMQKLARISMEFDNIAEKKWQLKNQIVKEYRARKEMLPEDLDTQILERSKDFEEEAFKKIEDIMSVQGTSNFKPGQTVDKLPNANEVPPGSIFTDDKGNSYKSDGRTWKKRV